MIRDVSVKDYQEIHNICENELGYVCEPALVKYRIDELDENREKVFVAEVEGAVIGFIHVEKYNVLYFEEMVNILGLAVKKNYQKHGYGKELIKAVETWAKENHIDIIRLTSGMGRKEAHKFYRAMGYVNEKEQIRFMKRL